jgi:hypothetical protein
MAETLESVNELMELPRRLKSLFSAAAPELRKIRPAAGGFSLTEQICHLRDLEQQGYLVRIRRILSEDLPELAEFDGAKVAQESDYHSQDPEAALLAFDTARSKSVSLLSGLSREQFERRGKFSSFGMITLRQLVDRMLEHDRSHLQELDQLSSEWPR